MSYRDDVNSTVKEGYWTFWKVLPLAVLVLVVAATAVFTLSSVGLIGKTVVERKVFESSYQRSAAQSAQSSIYRAQLASIQAQLQDHNLEPDTRTSLEAQRVAIQIRLNAIQ